MEISGELKLNQLSKNELKRREMNGVKGGSGCENACGPMDNDKYFELNKQVFYATYGEQYN